MRGFSRFQVLFGQPLCGEIHPGRHVVAPVLFAEPNVLCQMPGFVRYFWIMRIKSHTDQELVVVDSAVGISATLFIASLPLLYVATRPGKIGALFGACLFLLGALVWFRKTTFTFDASEQRVRWRGRKVLKVESGVVPFSEITGIGTEATFGSHGSNTYRLTILTRSGLVPLAYTYGGNQQNYASIREEILRFLHLEVPAPAAELDPEPQVEAAVDEASVRSLLNQGRKIDAIGLVQSSAHVGLTEAVGIVDQIGEKMRAAQ
jgi:hypothetical protein